MTMRVSFLFPPVIPANAGILFRQCRRFEMLNQVQHDVRYICEMPDHVRHDDAGVIPVPTRHSGECRNLVQAVQAV
jgi:tRNA(Leu) C34 or U34 (ribose-2'-O)-methylase TrmL